MIGLVEVTISGGQKNNDYYDNTLGNLATESDGSVSELGQTPCYYLSTVQSKKAISQKGTATTMLFSTDWALLNK